MWLVSFQQQWLSAFQEVILGKWGLQVNFGPYLYFDTQSHCCVWMFELSS